MWRPTTLQRGDPIEERYKDHSERGSVIDQLVYCINSYRDAAVSQDPKFDHIDLSEKQKVWICLVNVHHHLSDSLSLNLTPPHPLEK